MIYPKCLNPEGVVSVVRTLRDEIDMVTFDIFDTLVKRRIWPPDRTKIPAARAIQRILDSRGRRLSIEEILDGRARTEKALREISRKAGNDGEIHIRDWTYAYLTDLAGPEIASAYVDEVIDAELRGELSVCIPVDGMPEALRDCRELGKKTALISDMYLGESEIRAIVESCGYKDLFDNLYVSSEHKQAKHSGRLFRLMLNSAGCSPKRWAHFGDREHSDVLMPEKEGGRGFHFWPKQHDGFVDRVNRLARLAQIHPQWLGSDLMVCLQDNCKESDDKDLPYQIGFWVVGPVIANFIHQVIETVEEQEIQVIFFPARDGFVLREVYLKLAPIVGLRGTVPSEYVFLNRQTVFGSSLDQLGPREFRKGFIAHQRTLRTLLGRFGLSPEDFEESAQECGIPSLDAPIRRWFDDPPFFRFVRHPKFVRRLRERNEEIRGLLYDYLTQLGFWSAGSVALVDVGWSATVQETLTLAFKDHQSWPFLLGLYIGLSDRRWLQDTGKSQYRGLLMERPNDPIGKAPFLRYREIFELATRGPHPTSTALGRDPQTGRVIPVFRSTESEAYQLENRDKVLVTGMQAGIFRFC